MVMHVHKHWAYTNLNSRGHFYTIVWNLDPAMRTSYINFKCPWALTGIRSVTSIWISMASVHFGAFLLQLFHQQKNKAIK